MFLFGTPDWKQKCFVSISRSCSYHYAAVVFVYKYRSGGGEYESAATATSVCRFMAQLVSVGGVLFLRPASGPVCVLSRASGVEWSGCGHQYIPISIAITCTTKLVSMCALVKSKRRVVKELGKVEGRIDPT